MVKLITEPDRERVGRAVAEAEKATAGEIRVLVVGSSARGALWWGLIVSVVFSVGTYAWLARQAWGYPGWTEVAWSVGAGIVAGLLCAAAAVRVGKAARVQRRAEREFVRMGMGNTAGRTGVLLMLSLAEHRAVLLADKAIHEKVPSGTWDAILADLIRTLREGRAGDGLVAAVEAVGKHLAAHFPRRPDDVNELPDGIEVRK